MENISAVRSKTENEFGVKLTDDQHFVLCFIMGIYFAPHLKQGRPLKSALQRHVEGLPPYNAEELADSQIKIVVMESVYYYILREAKQCVVVEQPLFLKFINGDPQIQSEDPSAVYLKFYDLFPPKLHQRAQSRKQRDTMQSVVFIDNPEIGYLNPEDIERFKRLTGLVDFVLDRDSALLYMFVDNKVLCDFKVQEMEKLDHTLQPIDVQCGNYVSHNSTCPDGNLPSSSAIPFSDSAQNASPLSRSIVNYGAADDFSNGTLFLPSCPSKEEWSSLASTIRNGYVLTGSAAKGLVGPVLGRVDIGESVDSYLFRVSLPGVRRDERDFSCEVETNGRVLIKGVTVTGGRTVYKYSHAFEMQSQNLCPPGPFSISFNLPGPVDPQQFHGTFSADGILEGIALKAILRRS